MQGGGAEILTAGTKVCGPQCKGVKKGNKNEQIQHNIFFWLCFPFLSFLLECFNPSVPCVVAERSVCVDSRKNNQQKSVWRVFGNGESKG